MKTLSAIFSTLRRKNQKQYLLLSGCLFFSVLLITAYCLMMRSPTVLNTLPVGGDSRKQVMMIFVLAVIGCGAFSLYASGLFFRHKSRETGIFLALGASRKTLSRQLQREVMMIAFVTCLSGMLLGTPLAWFIWWIFRMVLVDTPEMALIFDFSAYGIPAAYSLFVILALLLMLSRSLKRTNILDIISEVHRAEPVRDVPRWFGGCGILLLAIGGLLGYSAPIFLIQVLHWYPPEGLTAIFYLPALIGLYMMLLHTVVNGWRKGKSRYPHLIATSMMKFQGRQTVRNMLVITVLTAGAYFAAFYAPMIVTPANISIENRPIDYAFFYRADQSLPTQEKIEQLAAEYGVSVQDFIQQSSASLAVDGYTEIESEGPLGTTYTLEYMETLCESRFFPESAWNALTGENLDLPPGTATTVFDAEGSDNARVSNDITRITNPVTSQVLFVETTEPLKNDLLFGCRVLDDTDYAEITKGLTDEWREQQIFFNVQNDSYAFAKALFYEIVSCCGAEVEIHGDYDRIERERWIKNGKPYFFDSENLDFYGIPPIDYSQPDSSVFRLDWKYMPEFRILDRADLTTQLAVFLLLFVFISILCFTAVGVILFTRSMTLTLTNAWVYEDLKKLGASNTYLRKTARGQTARIFVAPVITGTLVILCFYLLILYANDGRLSASEQAGFGCCLIVVTAISAVIYGLYRLTLHSAWKHLNILTSRLNTP